MDGCAAAATAPAEGGPVQGRQRREPGLSSTRAREKSRASGKSAAGETPRANSSGWRRSVRDRAAISRAVLSELHENGGVESRSPPPASRRLRLAGRSLPGQRQLLAQAHCGARELLVYIEPRGWSPLSLSLPRDLSISAAASYSRPCPPVSPRVSLWWGAYRSPTFSTESRVVASLWIFTSRDRFSRFPLCRRKRGKSRRRIRRRRRLAVRRCTKKGGAVGIFFVEKKNRNK